MKSEKTHIRKKLKVCYRVLANIVYNECNEFHKASNYESYHSENAW